jgi:hypothetical protein
MGDSGAFFATREPSDDLLVHAMRRRKHELTARLHKCAGAANYLLSQ